MKDIF
jgi:calcium-dependent protein kinase